MLKLLLYVLITFHHIFIACVLVSLVRVPFTQPPEVAILLTSLGVWQMTTGGKSCPVTKLENVLRKRVAWKEIGGFVGHYYIQPITKGWLKRKTLAKEVEQVQA